MRHQKTECGQALVEAVLVLIVFLITLIGLFDMAQMLFLHSYLEDRARRGARFAAVQNPFDAAKIQNVVVYGTAEPPDGASGSFGLTPANVLVNRAGAGTSASRVTVQITNFQFRFFTPYLAGLRTGRPITASTPYEEP